MIVEDAFRVFISSGLKSVERILALEKEPDEDVKKLESRIRAIDAKRRDYYQYYSGNEWGKPKNYDLCLNSGTRDRAVRGDHCEYGVIGIDIEILIGWKSPA